MALEQQLRLQNSTSLVMTPQLQQAIKLLQFSHQELENFIVEQLADNPLLSLEEEGEEPPLALPIDTYPIKPGESGGTGTGSQSLEDWQDPLIPAAPISLREHLLNQVNSDFTDPIERFIGTHLIAYVHPTGYFEGNINEIAAQLGAPLPLIEKTLHRLQQFDPAGVCASNLQECLRLQLEDRHLWSTPFKLLLDHIDLLAKGDLPSLSKKCHVDEATLKHLIQEIRSLSPKPGLVFEQPLSPMIVSEVLMVVDPLTGGWAVDLNAEAVPKVLLDISYYTRIKETLKEREDKHYLAERLAHANWLIKALHQRATTLIKVSSEIVRQQEAFFTHGIAYLKPLVLRDVAEAVGLHESTISRVTNNKYMSTPRGIFELKYFFNAALEGASGISYASISVRHRIQTLISGENPQKPLSDERIADILSQEGVDVARRTVAKYRDMLKIPPAFQRKRWQSVCGPKGS